MKRTGEEGEARGEGGCEALDRRVDARRGCLSVRSFPSPIRNEFGFSGRLGDEEKRKLTNDEWVGSVSIRANACFERPGW